MTPDQVRKAAPLVVALDEVRMQQKALTGNDMDLVRLPPSVLPLGTVIVMLEAGEGYILARLAEIGVRE